MSVYEEYKQKLRTPAEAVQAVKSGDWVDYGADFAQPTALDMALAARRNELSDVNIRGSLTYYPRQVIEQDPDGKAFTYQSWHFSGLDRKYRRKYPGKVFFNPMLFRNLTSYYTKCHIPVDVAMLSVSPMDNKGFFNFSLCNVANKEVADVAKIVILEVHKNLPRVCGGMNHQIHISDVDYIVEANPETEEYPLPTTGKQIPATDIDRRIAALIVPEIRNGATIQLGIGGMPNTVGQLIAESDLKDLGGHTELMNDAYRILYEKGVMNNTKKAFAPGVISWATMFGTKELYDWASENPVLSSYPIHVVNDPAVIATMDDFISVNSCVDIDLYGQISSESSGYTHISGTGGQLDFIEGAYRSKGGKSFICCPSTFTDKKTGNVRSRIVLHFQEGTAVTAPRPVPHYVVTEFGKVCIAGSPIWQRAEKMISIAHPDFREKLIKEAEAHHIWRRSNKR